MKAKVALVKTSDRAAEIPRVIDLLGINPVEGKKCLLKPNFNTADPFPGSTHNDTLKALVVKLKEMGSTQITVGDRSGPVNTGGALVEKGIPQLCQEMGADLINFEEMDESQWVHLKPEKSHWRNGFYFARPVLEAESVVTTCCIKTHGYGGIFTMSLKLSIGMVHKQNMMELHTAMFNMRKMIAEVNQAYRPSLIVLDGIEAFVDGGPMTGTVKRADVILAGTDRVAIDAVGLAILKELGSNKKIIEKRIFEQEQIARAVEIGLGVSGQEEIEIVTGDGESGSYADKIKSILLSG